MNATLPKTPKMTPQRAKKCVECGKEFVPVPLAHAPSFFTIDCAKCEGREEPIDPTHVKLFNSDPEERNARAYDRWSMNHPRRAAEADAKAKKDGLPF